MPSFLTATTSLQLLSLAFLAILFLQSGLDKVFNYKGNLEWLTGHFAKSPLKNTVGILMPVITLMETAAGVLTAIGCVQILMGGSVTLGLLGAQLAALSILSLFFGQRLAQDYEGAGNLVPYFLLCLACIYLLG
jgi:uncharacterized membrane protein YphA (DoxX/SURF4 family)